MRRRKKMARVMMDIERVRKLAIVGLDPNQAGEAWKLLNQANARLGSELQDMFRH